MDIVNADDMVILQIFYKETTNLTEIKDNLSKITTDGILFREEYFKLDSKERKESLYAKKVLANYGTNQVPFMLFINESKKEYGALYNESKSFTIDKIKELIKDGYKGKLQ